MLERLAEEIIQITNENVAEVMATLAKELGPADTRIDLEVDTPVAYYQVKLNSMFKVTGQPCGVAPYGVAVAKGNGLTQAITDAVNYLLDNGFYKKILDNWNVASGAIPTIVLASSSARSISRPRWRRNDSR